MIANAARSLRAAFTTVTDQLVTLLDSAVNRMRTAYQNYVSTESTNTSNLR